MDDFLRELATAVVVPLFMMAIFMTPVFGLTTYILRVKRRMKEEAEDPFSDAGFRPPGESLRHKIEELTEKQQDWLMLQVIIAIVVALTVTLARPDQRTGFALLGAIAVLTHFLWTRRRILQVTHELWNARLGFAGERAVGELLNRMMVDGYQVFHDVPFDNFNIDHVLVGPTGVFAIETKARRKPKEDGKKLTHKIGYDGKALQWPRWRDEETIQQALANQRSLSKKLSESTGEAVKVQPIVTAPGWWIDDNNQHPVWALNPKRIRSFVTARPIHPLSAGQIQRVAHQLQLLCQMKF